MEDSKAITAGFGVLFVGVLIMLAGVFLGGELALVGAGGVLMIGSTGGFVLPAIGDDHDGGTGAH